MYKRQAQSCDVARVDLGLSLLLTISCHPCAIVCHFRLYRVAHRPSVILCAHQVPAHLCPTAARGPAGARVGASVISDPDHLHRGAEQPCPGPSIHLSDPARTRPRPLAHFMRGLLQPHRPGVCFSDCMPKVVTLRFCWADASRMFFRRWSGSQATLYILSLIHI